LFIITSNSDSTDSFDGSALNLCWLSMQ